MWKAFLWPSADQMRHLKAFVLSAGRRYQDLVPCTDQISPNRAGKPKGVTGWAYGARTPQCDLFLLYFERDCPQVMLSGVRSGGEYRAQWFDPRTGRWSEPNMSPTVMASSDRVPVPQFPGEGATSRDDWALKLTLVNHP